MILNPLYLSDFLPLSSLSPYSLCFSSGELAVLKNTRQLPPKCFVLASLFTQNALPLEFLSGVLMSLFTHHLINDSGTDHTIQYCPNPQALHVPLLTLFVLASFYYNVCFNYFKKWCSLCLFSLEYKFLYGKKLFCALRYPKNQEHSQTITDAWQVLMK